MRAGNKTKAQLMDELNRLQERINELEASGSARRQTGHKSPPPDGPERPTDPTADEWKRRYEALAAAANQIVYERNPKKAAVHWSRSVETVLGYSIEEMGLELSLWKDLIHPQDRERIVRLFELAEQQKSFFNVQYRFRHKKGHYLLIHDRGYPFPAPRNGEIIYIGIMEDVTEYAKTEEALKQNVFRMSGLLELSRMTGKSETELTDFTLEKALELTGSQIGYLAFTNNDETVLTMYSWSRSAMEQCRIQNKPIEYPVVATGLWGEAVRQRKPIITNDYEAPNPWKKGYPEGHVPVRRHMNVPVFDGDRIVIVAGVGNKEEPYNETDVLQLTLLMDGMWKILKRKRAEEALEQRILTLTRPMKDQVAGLRFEELFNVEEIQKLQDAFASATGVASIITDPDGNPLTHPSNFCRLCEQIIRKTEIGLKNCYHSDAILGRIHPGGPIMQPCLSGGLWDGGTAICVGDQHIANWLIGQVLEEPIDRKTMMRYAETIGANAVEYEKALEEVTRMPRAQFARVCQCLDLFSRILSDIAFQNVQQAREITERRKVEEALRDSEERFRLLVINTADIVWKMDAETRYVYVSPQVKTILGYAPEDLLGRTPFEFLHKNSVEYTQHVFRRAAEQNKEILMYTCYWTHRDGHVVALESRAAPIRRSDRSLAGFSGVDRDITERKRVEEERLELERRLQQSQKLESLGVLAGGIAHDFNNLLMAILGNLDLTIQDLPPDSSILPFLHQAVRAAHRAADLTRQMLAYSGKGRFLVGSLILNDLVVENANLFRASVAKTMDFHLRLDQHLPPIEADGAQIQQVIMNLITNAAEAIGDRSGTISLSTGAMHCTTEYLEQSRLEEKPLPGRYVWLEVADTGCGMDQETLRRLFEPFFTTKFTGRGLGLSAVLGIVRGHKGAIMVRTRLGHGTTIRVLFPTTESVAPEPGSDSGSEGRPTQPPSRPGLRGTLLVADDEDMVRSLCATMLERLGYFVLTAVDGADAVEIFQKRSREITGVILDLSMPQMDGLRAFKEMRRIQPNVRVILSSGYNELDVIQRFANEGLAGFIQKPYLLENLREALERAFLGTRV